METILGNMLLTDTLVIMKRAKEDLPDQDYVSYLEEINKVCESEASILYKQAQNELKALDSITLGEMDNKLYADIDKKVGEATVTSTMDGIEITEDELNNLFSNDRTDQFNEVEEDIMKRSEEYNAGRPLDP